MAAIASRDLIKQLNNLFGRGTLAGLGEGQLLERFVREHDETAFEKIGARHGPMVLGICQRQLDNSHDIDDAFQAVFLILVRKAGSLRDRNALSSWLYGVALKVGRCAAQAPRGGRRRFISTTPPPAAKRARSPRRPSAIERWRSLPMAHSWPPA